MLYYALCNNECMAFRNRVKGENLQVTILTTLKLMRASIHADES